MSYFESELQGVLNTIQEDIDRTGQHKLTVPIAFDQPWNKSYRGPRLRHHGETFDLLNKLEDYFFTSCIGVVANILL